MSGALSKFNQHADNYDVARNLMIPPYDSFYGTAVEAVGLAGPSPARVIDLGAGTGLLAGLVLDAYPDCEVTLLDGAPAMLDKARENFSDRRAAFVLGDLHDELPEGPWDAVVSALAIHHMEDDGKRHAYSEAHRILRPGGIFVNSEHVLAPTPFLDAEYQRWHEHEARRAGVDDAAWAAYQDRKAADRLSPLSEQLEWLAEAGFDDVDCLFKDRGYAVLFGRKPAG